VPALAHAAVVRMQQLPLYDAAVSAWALMLLLGDDDAAADGGGSSRNGGGVVGSGLPARREVWAALGRRLAAAAADELDEASALAVLRAAMAAADDLLAARAAGPGGGGGGGGAGGGGWAGGGGGERGRGAVGTGQKAGPAALPGPRATREEVDGLLLAAAAPAGVRRRVLEAYQARPHVAFVGKAVSATAPLHPRRRLLVPDAAGGVGAPGRPPTKHVLSLPATPDRCWADAANICAAYRTSAARS
jgi:hypothetical protein